MCTICAALRPYDDSCDYEGLREFATVSETVDAAGSTATAYSMDVGDIFTGSLGFLGDRDWVAITLTRDQTYTIDLTGVGLTDPYLRLYDNNGNLLTFNDDNGSLDSSLTVTATRSGTYYISAGAFSDSYTGSYTIAVREDTPPDRGDVYTMDEIATQLTDGYWESTGRTQRAFDVGPGGELTVDIDGMSAQYQQLARWALEAWTNVTGIEFREVSFGADITFFEPTGTDAGSAFATSSTSTFTGGTILSSEVTVGGDWHLYGDDGFTVDGYTFQTFVHEIGHALGLGHAGNYNGNATYGTDNDYANDSWQATVMSYFDQNDNDTINADRALLLGPMIADIIAIQNLYGDRSDGVSVQAGATTWGANSNVGGYLGQVFGQIFGEDPADSTIYTGRNVAFTIYDTSGRDTIDLSPSDTVNTVDMREEAISSVMGLRGNMIIARDTVIENYVGGSARDRVTGNNANNKIWGENGGDRLKGQGGSDTLYGGKGKDALQGQNGRDDLRGQGGNDNLKGGGGNDRLDGGKGNDTLRGQAGNDTFVFEKGQSGNDRIIGFQENRDTIEIDLNGSRPGSVDVSTANGNTIISHGGDTITLVDVRLDRADIDFDFV